LKPNLRMRILPFIYKGFLDIQGVNFPLKIFFQTLLTVQRELCYNIGV